MNRRVPWFDRCRGSPRGCRLGCWYVLSIALVIYKVPALWGRTTADELEKAQSQVCNKYTVTNPQVLWIGNAVFWFPYLREITTIRLRTQRGLFCEPWVTHGRLECDVQT
ncbi:hypothetical protein V8E53_002818 [Lactarius tabidus]